MNQIAVNGFSEGMLPRECWGEATALILIEQNGETACLTDRKNRQLARISLTRYRGCVDSLYIAVLDAVKGIEGDVLVTSVDGETQDAWRWNMGPGREITASLLFDCFMYLNVFPQPSRGILPPAYTM